MNAVITGKTFAQVYEIALDEVFNNYDFECSPRGSKIRESINVTLELTNPLSNLFSNQVRSVPTKYLANELRLYLTACNSAEEYGKHASLWKEIANPDGTINSAYGNLIFKKENCLWNNAPCTQWEWARNSLLKDPDTRQAIMHYNTPAFQDSQTKDFVCTMSNQFFIRENKLYMNYNMRSNDIFYGTTYDLVWASVLMQCMYNSLLPAYEDLELGTLSYFASSLHIYEKHFEKAAQMLKYDCVADELPPVKENPIFHPALENMSNSTDAFINWILANC